MGGVEARNTMYPFRRETKSMGEFILRMAQTVSKTHQPTPQKFFFACVFQDPCYTHVEVENSVTHDLMTHVTRAVLIQNHAVFKTMRFSPDFLHTGDSVKFRSELFTSC